MTARHSQKLSPDVLKDALDDAGFDIVATPTVAEHHQQSYSGTVSRLQPTLSRKRLKHIQQCPQCQLEQEGLVSHDDPRDKLGKDTLVLELPQRTDLSAASQSDFDEKKFEDFATPTPTLTTVSVPPAPYNVTLSVGGMTCASCSNTLTRIISGLPGVSDVVVNLLANSASVKVDKEDRVRVVVESIEDAGYDADLISVELVNAVPPSRREPSREEYDGPYHVTLSVGGMTCAACTNTVTALASDIPGVSEVVVNLIGKSASATIVKKDLADHLAEAIEDAGYEAEVVALEPIGTEHAVVSGPRTVSLRIEGMFCS